MSKYRIIALGMLCALVLAVLLAAWSPSALAQDGATPTAPATSIAPEEVLKRAEAALQRTDEIAQATDRSLETVSRMLSFLEVAGAIAAIVLTIATTVGAGAFLFVSRRLTKTLKQAEQLHEKAEQMLQDIEQRGEAAARAGMLLQIGVQQMMVHNHSAALLTLEEARTLDPSNRAVNYYLGELYSQMGDPERAIPLLQASADAFPPAQAALGYALRLKAGRQSDPHLRNQLYAQAEQHFLSALERDPQARDINGASFYATLGGLYRRQGRLDDAIRAYQAASHVTPHSSYPLNNLAMLHLMKGDRGTAEEIFRKSARIAAQLVDGDPFDHWARFDLITAFIAVGEHNKAHEQLELLAESPPGVNALESFLSGIEALQQSGVPVDAQLLERLRAIIAKQKAAQPA
ncbi:MAG: tetratricopeptide repeat protein [Aggregatilineales bacterium]